jgi:hypothetical protein
MINKQRLFTGLLACGLALAMVSPLAAQTAEGAARVVRVKGPARYMVAGGAWQPLKAGTVLRSGTVVQTGKDKGSYVDLVLGDGSAAATASEPVAAPPAATYRPYVPATKITVAHSATAEQNVVRVLENTALGLDKLTYQQTGADVVSETQLDLKAGRIFGSVPKLSPASRYEIKLPNGVAGIRGTKYLVSADGTVIVLKGSVVIAYVDPATGNTITRVVSANEAFNPGTGTVGPASADQIKQLKSLSSTATVTGPQATTYAVDQTIYRVSPTKGKGQGPPFTPPGPPPVVPPGPPGGF